MHAALLGLFDVDAGVRERAVVELPLGPLAHLYALREVLLRDEDGSVRAQVPARLVEANDQRVVAWLCEAVSDERPSVRDAAWNALARLEVKEALPLAQTCLASDEVWWVRRAALRATWRALGEGALPVLLGALEDPFWRVRHAATQALAGLVTESSAARRAVEALRSSSDERLRRAALWVLSGDEALPEPVTAHLDGVDEDPAVTTARLERESLPAATLVRLLGDPHEALRRVARRRLVSNSEPSIARAVAAWLDEPRVPHAAETARACLEEMSVDRLVVARTILADETSGQGQLVWACAAAARLGDEADLSRVRALLGDGRARVRVAAALALVDEPSTVAHVVAHLADAEVRSAVEAWWLRQPRPPAELTAALHATTTSRVVKLATAPHPSPEALEDADGPVRALAVAGLTLTAAQRDRALADEDPWVRRAALDLESAGAVSTTDPDPPTRRLAASLLARERASLTPERRRALSAALASAEDAELRATAAVLLQREDVPDALAWVLRLSRDPSLAVRGAAASALESCDQLSTALEAFLRVEREAELRISAFTWLLRDGDKAAFTRLVSALEHESDEVRAHLLTVSLVFPDELVATAPHVQARQPRARVTAVAPPVTGPALAGRALGKTGVVVSPVILSGVNELNDGAWAEAVDAGVTSFFWEPGYRSLGRFLQRARRPLVVVTGTYHSGARALRRDVERHLKALGRETLDVFLLFWVRSAERVDDENLEALTALRAEGKLRTFGFSSHLRDVAANALDRGWPVVMTRFSAAHPGASARLLPTAARVGAGVLGFTTTCYGRLLQRVEGTPADFTLPTASECYRWALGHEPLAGVVSAPRSWRELVENVKVLHAPPLAPPRSTALEEHGVRVRALTQRFNALVRQASVAPFPGSP